MILTETNPDAIWYEVADPAKLGCRVELINNARVYLMMRARKTADVEMFARPPQQSDYQGNAWQREVQAAPDVGFLKRPPLQRIVERFFPRPARNVCRRLYQATRRHFTCPGLTKSREF
jgi:hypothetical protein